MFGSTARTALCCGAPALNPLGSHPNEAWWVSQVCCARAELVDKPGKPSQTQRYYSFDEGKKGALQVRTTVHQLRQPPYGILGKDVQRTITAFTEVRQPYWRLQPQCWVTYHSFTILEVDGGAFYILLERKSDLLEMVIGQAGIAFPFMKAFRAVGGGRNMKLCVQQPRQELEIKTTIYQLLEWIDGPLEESWRPYNLLSANCQHFANQLHSFLLKPFDVGMVIPLNVAPVSERRSREKVMAAVRQNWQALKYAHEDLRRDKEVVLTALKQDGRALRYVHIELRLDKETVLAAVRQNGYALPYVEGHLRQDGDVVLAAVEQKGHMLCYAAGSHRSDRKVALAAVRQDAHAVRFIGEDLKSDSEILLAAALRNPAVLARLPFV